LQGIRDFVLAAAANVRGVLLCVKGGVTPDIYSRFLHVGICPHPALITPLTKDDRTADLPHTKFDTAYLRIM